MLQLKNNSPFEPAINVFPDENGVDTLYVVIKATFEIGETLAVAEVQVPPTLVDEYWGEPAKSSLKYASEMHLTKPTTDVVLVGQAWAREGTKVETIDVIVSVADRLKLVRVFGNRKWRPNLIRTPMTAPEPFESMPLVYERSFGGIHEIPEKEKVLAEDRNPVGVGFGGKRKGGELLVLQVPNLEDPQHPVRKPGGQAVPACFGFVAPYWLPRRSFAGTYDEGWAKNRAPYLPTDFDSRFFNAAHPDLICDGYLQGGEPVRIANASRKGRLSFTLPRCSLQVKVRISTRTEEPAANLETVLIEPDEDRLCLTWRASMPCDKETLKISQVEVGLADLQLNGKGA